MVGTTWPERAFRWIRSSALSKRGKSPEAIQEDFPGLKRAQIYGAIAFYLDHEAEIDKYLENTRREFEGCGTPVSLTNPVLWDKIQRSRTHAGESHS